MATFALISWPLIAMFIFSRLGVARGLIWSVALGYLFLPEKYGIDLPGLPPFFKTHAIAFGCLLGLLLKKPSDVFLANRDRRAGPKLAGRILVATVLFSPVLTMLANRDPILFIDYVKPAISPSDVLAMSLESFTLLVPFLIAQRVLHTPELHKELLRVMVLTGLAYTALILFEVRMSPQLHRWTYGYFQHSWIQHVRGGDFRPIVFLKHGLSVGMLLLSCTIAAGAILRINSGNEKNQKYLFACVWLFLVLLISKNLGAFSLALVFLPLTLLTSRRVQTVAALSVSILLLTYPAARQAEILPIDGIVSLAQSVSAERGESLQYRLVNEDVFMARAKERPLTGWGVWARWRIADEYGRDLAVSDGRWVSYLGERGWIGYLAFFGLLSLPLLYLVRQHTRLDLTIQTTGLAMIIAANLIYLIPNNALSPYNIMIVGALIGLVQTRATAKTDAETQETEVVHTRSSRYTRFSPVQR